MQNNNLEREFLAQTASKRLISLVIGGIAAFFALGLIAPGAFSFFVSAPLVLIALLYYWFQHRELLSKISIIASIAFLLFSCWGFIALFNTGQTIPASPSPSPVPTIKALPTTPPKPTFTPRPTRTPTPDGSSQQLAAPLGASLGFSSGAAVSVVGTIDNANRAVREHDAFTSPPEGHQFYIVQVKVENTGNEPIRFGLVRSLAIVGESSIGYKQGLECWTYPNEFDTSKTIFPGGEITGNICFTVLTEDVGSFVMYYEIENIFGSTGEFVYWKLK